MSGLAITPAARPTGAAPRLDVHGLGVGPVMGAVASDDVLAEADAWLCRRRRAAPSGTDVWHLPCQWDDIKPRLQAALQGGIFRLESTRTLRLDDGTIEICSRFCLEGLLQYDS